MKKIYSVLVSLIILTNIIACAGYKPIFGSSNLEFQIEDYSIKADKKLGNKIYSKLYRLSQSNKNNSNAKSIYIIIESSKDKHSTAKNSAGKILGYKISLSTNFIVKDFLTKKDILSQNFTSSSSFKVQDQHSETVRLENQILDTLLNKTYEDFLIILSEIMITE